MGEVSRIAARISKKGSQDFRKGTAQKANYLEVGRRDRDGGGRDEGV